jgi:hypothetical protein
MLSSRPWIQVSAGHDSLPGLRAKLWKEGTSDPPDWSVNQSLCATKRARAQKHTEGRPVRDDRGGDLHDGVA